MLQATKIAIFPTDEQRQRLAVQFGCARYVWNEALRMKSTAWKERQESLSCHAIKGMLPDWKKAEDTSWLTEADSQVLQQSILNLDAAFKRFFANGKDRAAGKTRRRVGFPRFKSKRAPYQSVQYPQRVKLAGRQLYLPKVGWVDAKIHREIVGKVKTVTVKRTPSGKYYAAVLTDNGVAQPIPIKTIDADKVLGVDLGLSRLATTTQPEIVPSLKPLRDAYRRLRRAQKRFSRRRQGSANRHKARLRVARCHERIANIRNDRHHQLSFRWASENQAVVLEDLAVSNMLKNRRLAKSIADAGWRSLRRMLTYKLERQGKHAVVVDRFFASSKTCHDCGHQLDELALDVRRWICPSCHAEHDRKPAQRDLNAALNIKQQGIHQLRAEGYSVPDCGRLRKPSVPEVAAVEAVTSFPRGRSIARQGGE